MSGPSSCTGGSFEAEIRSHFVGSIAPKTERTLRLHLAECASCRELYERYLVLNELDPKALSAEERIGRGLGMRARPPAMAWPTLAVAGVAAVALLAVGVPALTHRDPANSGDREFSPRGPVQANADFVVYRVRPGEAPERAPLRMRRTDELAFAYTNPDGFAHLLVFGVDATSRVHWYHPEWSDANATPHAVAIAKGADARELPDAVSQTIEGPTLRLYAVFTNELLSVKDIEGSLSSDQPGNPVLELPGVLVRQWLVEVE